MASGFGFTGGRSRCFTHWQEFQKCYLQTDFPLECRPQVNDYLECLHHPKELTRAKLIQEEFAKQATASAKEGKKASDIMADGVITGLGLIRRSKAEGEEDKHKHKSS